jgi:hypothetical protein
MRPVSQLAAAVLVERHGAVLAVAAPACAVAALAQPQRAHVYARALVEQARTRGTAAIEHEDLADPVTDVAPRE